MAKRCAYTQENPEINQIPTQNQAKQDDWPKETRNKCPTKATQTTTAQSRKIQLGRELGTRGNGGERGRKGKTGFKKKQEKAEPYRKHPSVAINTEAHQSS